MNYKSKKTYQYYVYGELLICNIKLPILETVSQRQYCKKTIELNVNIGHVGNDTGIKKNHNNYTVFFPQTAIYTIYEHIDRIDCIATSVEGCFSTLFNIPFSIYFLIRNEMLIHGCSMVKHDKCLCFTGHKGVGKTTLVSLLDGEDLILWGDDTLRVKNDLTAYRAHNLIKITDETSHSIMLRYNVTQYKNLVGKSYGILPPYELQCTIGAIIELSRSHTTAIIRPINEKLIRNIILKRNIVGINCFDKHLLDKINYIKLDSTIKCFSLVVPDSIAELNKKEKNIKEILQENIYEQH